MSSTADTANDPGLSSLIEALDAQDAVGRIKLLADAFKGRVMATSSFGLQSSVMLHLLKKHAPEIPIVFVDTGYLFPETYRYAHLLEEEIGFEARVYQPAITAARQEALHGKLWEEGREGAEEYARVHKVEPMNRALQELGADVWISGLRRSQSRTRSSRAVAEKQSKTLKVYPIIDWDDERVEQYLRQHALPRHPLAAAGYVTMGDWHSTRPAERRGTKEETRFNGEKYECGLHLDSGVQDFQI